MDSRLRGNDELGGRNDECGGGVIQALSKPRNVIFVPITLTRLVPLSLNSYEAHW